MRTKLFSSSEDVANVLAELGYKWKGGDRFSFSSAVRQFQSDYNTLSNEIPTYSDLQIVNWIRVPKGALVADGTVGPWTMNALEIALVNQRGGVPWEQVLLIATLPNKGGEKTRIHDAIKGW